MTVLYTAILYLATPLILLRLLWAGRRNRAYWRRWSERFGFYRVAPAAGGIWLHAVSVGEVIAALPLVERLLAHHPDLPVTVTTMTPTGSERVRALLGDRVHHVYLPYDLPGAVRRFLDTVRPRAAVVMETELWPNLFAACAARAIPLLVANARLSARSAAGYARFGALARRTLGAVTVIAAQGEVDAARFVALGADPERVVVTGSIKFDLSISDETRANGRALREALGAERPVWIAASTHEGEEALILDAHAALRADLPNALLILVPRHPERFDRVAALCTAQGFKLSRRGTGTPQPGADVYLGDTMGELRMLYAAADVAFVGGSLVATGGHNPLEPAALGLPVVTGPHLFNFATISGLLQRADAAAVAVDAAGVAVRVGIWLADAAARREAGEAGQRLVASQRGALDRLAALVEAQLGDGHA